MTLYAVVTSAEYPDLKIGDKYKIEKFIQANSTWHVILQGSKRRYRVKVFDIYSSGAKIKKKDIPLYTALLK